MSARNQYFETLLSLFSQHIEETDERKEHEIKEKILSFIEENPIPEYEKTEVYPFDDVL